MSIETIKDNYKNGEYNPKIPYPKIKKYPTDHVFDENKSVKWNREQVEIENAKQQELLKMYGEEKRRLNNKLHDDVINTLTEDYGLTKDVAKIVESYVSLEHQDDYFYYLDEMANFANDILANSHK